MKPHWTASILFLALALAGCNGNSTETTTPNPTGDSLKTDSLAVTGNVKRVYATGYFFRGQPTDERKRYEEFTYDDQGREVGYASFFDAAGTHVKTDYDAQGHEVLRVSAGTDPSAKVEYRSTWNADHTEQKMEEFSTADSRVVFRTTRRFDAKGNLVELEEEDLHIVDFPVYHKLKMVRDKEGRVTEERETFQGKEIVGAKYRYDAQGNLVEVTRMDNEGKPSQTEYFQYDSQNRKEKRFLQEHTGIIKAKQLAATYEYDPNGRLVKEAQYKGQCDEAGQNAGKCPITETVTYTYDDQGRMTAEERIQQYPSPRTLKKEFEYFGKVPVK